MPADIRIGCGAGFANDRYEPARDLASRGALDFLIFEGLAERTLAQAQLARAADPPGGFNPTLERRLRDVLPATRASGCRIVTNMGAANPAGAAAMAAALARGMQGGGLRIATVTGDDVTDILPGDTLLDTGERLDARRADLIGANAYLGAGPIAAALDDGADLVITGRCADPSLALGPLMHAHGWAADDWDRLGAGTLAGHLLECSAQVTGGYFADPGVKDVPGLATLGYPLAEVAADGTAVITKLPGTGGCVTRATVIEQMLYEVHDPAAYLTPDVAADFAAVAISDRGCDRVAVAGARGRTRPARLKVTVGFRGGWLAEAGIGYAGRGALARARLAGSILRERMERLHGLTDPLRIDLIGAVSLFAAAEPGPDACRDVRLRAALRTRDRAIAETLVHEVETLWIAGPAGGGGARGRVVPTVTTASALIDRDAVRPRVTVAVA